MPAGLAVPEQRYCSILSSESIRENMSSSHRGQLLILEVSPYYLQPNPARVKEKGENPPGKWRPD